MKAVDATHSDPVKDVRGCYKRGDVVVVMPDGHEWGNEERLPKFVVIKIPGLAIADVQHLCDPSRDAAGERTRRRRWNINQNGLPGPVRSALAADAIATATRAQVFAAIVDKG